MRTDVCLRGASTGNGRRSRALLAACAAMLAALLALLAGRTCMPVPALAEEPTGSLTVTLKDASSAGSDGAARPVAGGSLELYLVADAAVGADGALSCAVTPAFAGSGAALDDVSSAELAVQLAAWAQDGAFAGTSRAALTVDVDGTARFADLASGLYLVVQDEPAPGYRALMPFVASVPAVDADGALSYDVTAAPKVEPAPDQSAATTTLAVRKVWADLAPGETRADGTQATGARIAHAPVTVDLLKDGTLYGSVELGTSNDWSYTWDGLPADASWSVVESQVPQGYAASCELAGSAEAGWSVTVTNTELAERLIQTGQLNWPVPVLAVAGVAVFALGWTLNRRAARVAGQARPFDGDASRGR